jgi:hypothetical protein
MNRDEAVRIARSVAEAEGWSWREPIKASRFRRGLLGPLAWNVWSNDGCRGMNVHVKIVDVSGVVFFKGYIKR